MIYLYYGVLVVHIFTCLFLVGVVLLQQGKGQDLASAFGGGVTQTAFGPRGSANVLSRMTTILAIAFMATSLSLSIIPKKGGSFLKDLPAAAPAPVTTPASDAPAASPAPPTGDSAASPAPAPADEPGKTSPLTDKDVGPEAK